MKKTVLKIVFIIVAVLLAIEKRLHCAIIISTN